MDEDVAKDLLNDGQTNSLTSTGTLVSDPSFVVEISKNGSAHSLKYGTVGSLSESDLDYLVHRVYDVTLSEQDQAYETTEFTAEIHYYDSDGNYKTTVWTATPDGWEDSH